MTPGQFWVSSGAASLLWYFGTADSWLAYYFRLEQKQLMSDFVDAYCLQKSRFSVVLFQLHGCLQLIDYWSIWQYKFTHFWCNHNCRLIMPALQKKYSSTSILAELSTEWQYWLTSLGSLKVLLMWNLLKLKLFRKLLSWTSQSCMAANSRCGSWCFLLSLSTANDLFHFLLPPLTLAFDISTFFFSSGGTKED